MPGRNGKGRDGVDALLKKDGNDNYRKAWEKMRMAEKINDERAMEHKLLWEKLKKIHPIPTAEDLMAHARRLENHGLLSEAADAYQQLLTRPDQFHKPDLRAHLAELVKKVNRRQAEAKVLARQVELEEEGRLWPGRPRGLESPRGGARVPGMPRGDKAVGPIVPMSSEVYRAELAAQAMEGRRRREAAKKENELLDQKQVAVAAAMEALEQHRRQVVAGNDKLALAQERELERRGREEERARQFYMEWDQLKPAPGRPLEDPDEERRRQQIQRAHAHRALMRNSYDAPLDPRAVYHDVFGHDPRVMEEELAGGGGAYQDQYYYQPGGAVAVGLRRRPASAGASAAAAAAARERERNNAANFGRLYVPGHPYTPAAGPPPMAAWPAPLGGAAAGRGGGGVAAGPGGGVRGILKSPYGRPDVERPKVRIDPEAVRAKQQAFIDKRQKPVVPQQQQVPLRQRKEAARRPSPPKIAAGAYGW